MNLEFNQTCQQINHSDPGNQPQLSQPQCDPIQLEASAQESNSQLDVFSELQHPEPRYRSPRRKTSGALSFRHGSERRPSIILNNQVHPLHHNTSVEGPAAKPSSLTIVRRISRIVRAIYLFELLYVGYALPIIVIGFDIYLPYLELCLDCLQIVYTGFKFAGKYYRKALGYCQQLWSLELLALLAILPLEFLQQPYMNYLFYLKAFRLVSVRKEIRYIYCSFVNRTENKLWGLVVGLHCAVVWMASFWISYSRWLNDSNSWYSNDCSPIQSGKCIVQAIYLVLQACFTIGYGDLPPRTLPEKMMMSVYMIVGVVIFSYFLAVFSNFFEERFFTQNEKQVLVSCINRMERKLPNHQDGAHQLVRSATRLILNQNALHLQEEENFDLLDLLPEETQARMSQHFNTHLGSLDFFKRFPIFNIVELLPNMKELFYKHKDPIIAEGDPSESVYIIREGLLLATVPASYQLPGNLCFALFNKKWSVGEYDVFPVCKPRRFSVVAGANCRVLALDAYSLKLYLDKSEDFSSLMNQYAKDKLYALSVLLRSTVKEYGARNNIDIKITASTEVLDDKTDTPEAQNLQASRSLVARDIDDLLTQQKGKLQQILQKLKSCQSELNSKIHNFEQLQRHIPQFYKGESAFKPTFHK